MAAMLTKADTCRTYVLPKLYKDHQISDQVTHTLGRVRVSSGNAKRGTPKCVDYLLKYGWDYPLAVVEAKAEYLQLGDGLQQAIGYGLALDVPFVYSTNGIGVVEHDFLTGEEREPDPARVVEPRACAQR